MRIVHVVASIDSEAAGPSVSVPRLAEAQARAGAVVEIATVADPAGASPRRTDVRHMRYPQSFERVPVLKRLALSTAMHRDFISRGSEIDVLHTHGLWLAPNVYPASAARRGVTFVLSPRGMLGVPALEFSKLKKRVFWYVAQKKAIAAAALIHATSNQEAEDVRAFGINTPITVVPNGVDIPPKPAPHQAKLGARTVLSMGRIHPKKGLDRLIEAWAEVEGRFPEWRLRVVGPSELGHADELRALAVSLGCSTVSIEGPLYGAGKLAAYREARIFVLPTLNENFAMSVAESLAAGTPVVSTKGAPWAGLEREGCGLWIDHGPAPLAAALCDLMSRPVDVLVAMGSRGREWMARDFSWDGGARSMLDAYERVRGQMPRPSEV